ncbi:agmatinase [Candidatus Woesearchaeota archaeon]|nr:agmatinase [Candidatus Woesearchaeota archaeon]
MEDNFEIYGGSKKSKIVGAMKMHSIFLGLDNEFSDYKKAKVAVLQVPYEGTVSYGKGASKGPAAIIEASKNMELYDEELDENFSTIGIATMPATKIGEDSRKTAENVHADTGKALADGKFPVILGGEHSFSWGAVKACKEKYTDLSVLYLDAHGDLRERYDDNKYSHACALKRIADIVGYKFVHVGTRSMSDEEAELIKGNRLLKQFLFAKDIVPAKDEKWIDKAVAQLSRNVYISIDIDCMDSGIMPTTGTPEPGGLNWYHIIHLMRKACQKRNVVGFDIVELAPRDGHHATDFLVAKLAYKIIGYKFFDKKKRNDRL